MLKKGFQNARQRQPSSKFSSLPNSPRHVKINILPGTQQTCNSPYRRVGQKAQQQKKNQPNISPINQTQKNFAFSKKKNLNVRKQMASKMSSMPISPRSGEALPEAKRKNSIQYKPKFRHHRNQSVDGLELDGNAINKSKSPYFNRVSSAQSNRKDLQASKSAMEELKETIDRREQENDRTDLTKQLKKHFAKGLHDLATNIDFYKFQHEIGKGSFGKVCLGTHKLTGINVAIKIFLRKDLENCEHTRKKVMQEITILKKTRHVNIVRILEVVEGDKYLFVVMEYWGGGDLLNYLKKRERIPEPEVKLIFKQILLGARVCHTNSILHRDFKLENVLLDEDCRTAKICDFGVSKIVRHNRNMYDQWGTPAYLAPEIIVNEGYIGFTVDIWSMGILLYALVAGHVPFKAPTIKGLYALILERNFTYPTHFSDELKNLVDGMLQLEPKNRLSMREVLTHPWFKIESDYHNPKGFIGRTVNQFEAHFVSESVEVDHSIVTQVEAFGFPKNYIVKSLQHGDLNHATTTYFLIHNEIHN